jgi:hypothetical protein
MATRYYFCYSWQYCINRVHDYPNIGLGVATAHAYRKRHFHPENMRRVSVFDLWEVADCPHKASKAGPPPLKILKH